jgi:hypothetical protein
MDPLIWLSQFLEARSQQRPDAEMLLYAYRCTNAELDELGEVQSCARPGVATASSVDPFTRLALLVSSAADRRPQHRREGLTRCGRAAPQGCPAAACSLPVSNDGKTLLELTARP